MLKTHIVKVGASNYYLQSGSAGSFLCPPGHACHIYEIAEYRGGHERGMASIEYAASPDSHFPRAVQHRARLLLKKYPGNVKDETWIKDVYRHLAHCYNVNGKDYTFGTFWGNAEDEKLCPPECHPAVIYIRKYDPTHTPRTDLF